MGLIASWIFSHGPTTYYERYIGYMYYVLRFACEKKFIASYCILEGLTNNKNLIVCISGLCQAMMLIYWAGLIKFIVTPGVFAVFRETPWTWECRY